MFYLIYVSSAAKLMETADLLILMQECVDRNRQLDITGMLIYKDGCFMQMLEGEEQTVLDLYEQIREDKRHTGVITIMVGETEKRNFPQWSMGFCNLDDSENRKKFSDYVTDNLVLRSFQDDAQEAYNFMVKFTEKLE